MNTNSSIYRVEWEDSETTIGWDEYIPPSAMKLVVSVGFLVHENKSMLTLGADADPSNGTWNRVISIPKSLIRKRQIIGK